MKSLATFAFLAGMLFAIEAAQAESYTFKVTNTTIEKMVKLQVSEDGKTWLPFDIGKGIGAGKSATMQWSEETNDQSCEQKVKAAYEDGTESEVAEFNFCEADLELEF